MQYKMLRCLERIAYELGSGRRVELEEYLAQVVYKENDYGDHADHDV